MTVVVAKDPGTQERLEQLGLTLVSDPGASGWQLGLWKGALALMPGEGSKLKGSHPLSVDFLQGPLRFRAQRARHEAVVRAVRGRKAIEGVIDATAGLGQDSYLLASAGLQVTLIEANPWVHALLSDGLYRARGAQDAAAQRMVLHAGDAATVLGDLTAEVVYLDPMFPGRVKSAKVGKGMQAFHEVVGPASGEEALLAAARAAATVRVVVKRPKGAPHVAHAKPASHLPQKTCRFDVYPA